MAEEKEHQRARNERLQRILNGKKMKSKDRWERNGGEIAGWVKNRVDGRKNIREKYRKESRGGEKIGGSQDKYFGRKCTKADTENEAEDKRGFGAKVCGFWEC